MRLSVAGLACAAALLLAAPAAVAAPVALRDAPRATQVALPGGTALLAHERPHGRVSVDAIPLDGGATRRVFTLPSLGRDWAAHVLLAASEQHAGLLRRAR